MMMGVFMYLHKADGGRGLGCLVLLKMGMGVSSQSRSQRRKGANKRAENQDASQLFQMERD